MYPLATVHQINNVAKEYQHPQQCRTDKANTFKERPCKVAILSYDEGGMPLHMRCFMHYLSTKMIEICKQQMLPEVNDLLKTHSQRQKIRFNRGRITYQK